MDFTNRSGAVVQVEVYNDTDRVALVPRWSANLEPGATVEYRPRAGDTRRYRAAVTMTAGVDTAGEGAGSGGKQWAEGLRDQGQSIDVSTNGDDLLVTATLDPGNDPANSGRNVLVFFPGGDPTVWAPDRMQVRKLNVVSVDFFQYSEVVATAVRLNGLPD